MVESTKRFLCDGLIPFVIYEFRDGKLTKLEFPLTWLTNLTESELLQRSKRRDPSAQMEYFRRHYKKTFWMVKRKYARQESMKDADEITSAAFFTVFWNIHTFSERSELSTWVYKHIISRAADHYQRPGQFSWIPQYNDAGTKKEKPQYNPKEDAYNANPSSLFIFDRSFKPSAVLCDPLGAANDAVGDVGERSEDLSDQGELEQLLFDHPIDPGELPNRLEQLLDHLSDQTEYARQVILYNKFVGMTHYEIGKYLERLPNTIAQESKRSIEQLEHNLHADPAFIRLMPKEQELPLNYCIDQRILEDQERNIQQAAKSTRPAPADVIYKHHPEYLAFEAEETSSFVPRTFESFFAFRDTQEQSLEQWLGWLETQPLEEVRKLMRSRSRETEISEHHAKAIRERIHDANKDVMRFTKPRVERKRKARCKSGQKNKDVLEAKPIQDNRKKDPSKWIGVKEYFEQYTEWAWNTLDALPDWAKYPYFRRPRNALAFASARMSQDED